MATLMQEFRFWQNDIVFKDGKKATLTIQSEKGRSDQSERVFVLQAFGGVRARQSWEFSFMGSPHEVPGFIPDSAADLLDNHVPYWLGGVAEKPVA